jgi:hypothetical protein
MGPRIKPGTFPSTRIGVGSSGPSDPYAAEHERIFGPPKVRDQDVVEELSALATAHGTPSRIIVGPDMFEAIQRASKAHGAFRWFDLDLDNVVVAFRGLDVIRDENAKPWERRCE